MAADEYRVTAVEETAIGTTPCWMVTLVRPDGGRSGHVFPKSTLEWRAAEYGIDPDDIEALLDIVLHEPYLPDPGPTPEGARGAGAAPAAVPNVQAAAGDLAAVRRARAVHLERIAGLKRTGVRVVQDEDADPLKAIRDHHGVDPERVAEKRRLLEGPQARG
ncbi:MULTISPECIES: hypothetical protein [Actinomadura]|uniref:Mu-like prophage FluMu N-terminal domain-containing protein n=1 Tax=Actinomadura yumaensis TaxID=111807 RepID=A0ABW2CVN1_9ACTN|nr:hypothetical protein [Actinomadura sp. J1-007]MWK37619.1 hypothetical protein [Actinomadura sp. J1-007]